MRFLLNVSVAMALTAFAPASALAARGATPSAFERRCIPPGGVAPPSNTPGILGRLALPAGSIAALGATMDLHHGLLGVSPSATIVGTVTLTAADGSTWAGDGARVALACGADRTTRIEVADEHGAFRFLNVPVDSCSIEADVQGFLAQPVTMVTAAQQVVGIELHLGVAPLRVGVNVGGTTPYVRGRRRWGYSGKEDYCHVTSND